MPFSLKRLASSLGLAAQISASPVPSGWNGLPEDIFNLIIEDCLQLDHDALTALSQTCRSYATFCRPHLLRTIDVTGAIYDKTAKKQRSQIEQFKHELKQRPQLCAAIGTLRITDTNRKMQLQTPGPRPTLTKDGESLLYILSQTFPHLKSFELPLLEDKFQWSVLSVKLQDAICSFLQRHALQELSLTTHYPLELVRHCQAVTKLEYRVYELSPPLESVDKALLGMHRSQAGTIALQELVIQDPVNEAANVAKHLVQPGSCIDLKKLEKLTYYGDNKPGSQLPALLDHFSRSLTSLNIYVSDNVNAPTLNLLSLRRLEHLTLSVDRTRQGPYALSWVADTIKLLFDNSPSPPPLQRLEVIVRVSGRTIEENIREMSYGWHGLKGSLGHASAKYASAWKVKELAIVVCTEGERVKALDASAVLGGLRSHLVPIFKSSMPSTVAVDAQLVRDTHPRWLRFPTFGRAPLH